MAPGISDVSRIRILCQAVALFHYSNWYRPFVAIFEDLVSCPGLAVPGYAISPQLLLHMFWHRSRPILIHRQWDSTRNVVYSRVSLTAKRIRTTTSADTLRHGLASQRTRQQVQHNVPWLRSGERYSRRASYMVGRYRGQTKMLQVRTQLHISTKRYRPNDTRPS